MSVCAVSVPCSQRLCLSTRQDSLLSLALWLWSHALALRAVKHFLSESPSVGGVSINHSKFLGLKVYVLD